MTEPKTKRPAHRPVTIDAKRVNVSLDQATIEKARELGGGNVSEGIRRAVRSATRGNSIDDV